MGKQYRLSPATTKNSSENDQESPQLQTADNPMVPRRAT